MQEVVDQALSIHANSEQLGLGVDVVDISHFRLICKRTPSFINKMFSESEINYANKKTNPEVHLAARFAAKEAVLKSLGVGFGRGVGYRDVEVKIERNGEPKVLLHNKAKTIADKAGVTDIPISITHTKTEAVCVAIAITKASIESKERANVAVDEVTKQFKELRRGLDEI